MKKNSKLSFVSKTIFFLNIIVIGLLGVSYLSTVCNPGTYWYIAFFGLGYPFILLANLLFIVYWLFRKAWLSLFSITAILLGLNHLKNSFGFRSAEKESFAADSSQIKLMTYNVHYFKRFGAQLDSSTRSGIFEMIKQEQPDILGFQEFFTRKKGAYHITDSIKKILHISQYYFQASVGNDYEATGIAVFSRYPIINSGEIKFNGPFGGNGAIWIDLKDNDRQWRVYVVHLASISFQPEDYEYLHKFKQDIETNEEDVASGKRILGRLKDAFIRRSEQVALLKAHMGACKIPYILMGDFNDTPVSYTLNTLAKGMKNAFVEKGSGFARTYNGEFPNFQIDYMLASPQFDFKTYKVIKKPFSDHYPLRTNVSLNH